MISVDADFEPRWHDARRAVMFVIRDDGARVNCFVPYEALSDEFGARDGESAMVAFHEHRKAIEASALARVANHTLDRPGELILRHAELY